MSKKINIGTDTAGGDVLLDLELLLSGKLLVQACSGGGKSFLLRRIIEQCWGSTHVVIIDPEGEFVSLQEKFEVVIAGAGGDIPLTPDSAAGLADVVMKTHANIVCDISEIKPSERHLWAQKFLEAFMLQPKEVWHNMLLVIDEAHLFAPERGQGDSLALEACKDLVARGRKRGLGILMATQRVSKLNKNVLSELGTVAIGRTTADIDRERVADTLGVSSKTKPALFKTLANFLPGHFFLMGVAVDSRDHIEIKGGAVSTTHAKSVGGQKVLSRRKIEDSFAGLLRELKKVQETEAPDDPACPGAFMGAKAANEIAGLRKQITVLEAEKVRLEEFNKAATEFIVNIGDQVSRFSPSQVSLPPRAAPAAPLVSQAAPPAPKVVPKQTEGDIKLGKIERCLMTALIGWGDLETDALALFAGYRESGSLTTALSVLRTSGLMVGNGRGPMKATPEGQKYVASRDFPEALMYGETLWNYWLSKMGLMARSIMGALSGNESLMVDQIAAITGYQLSGSFTTALSDLRTAGILVGKGRGPISLSPAMKRGLKGPNV